MEFLEVPCEVLFGDVERVGGERAEGWVHSTGVGLRACKTMGKQDPSSGP